MKKAFSLLLVVMLAFAMAAPVYADAGEKFTDGVKQMVMSPKVVLDTIMEEYDASEFKPLGAFGGLLKGLFYGAKEVGLGLVNTLTFFVDND